MRATTKHLALLLAAGAAVATVAAAAEARRPDPLLGNWRAVAMERSGKGKSEVPAGVELYAEFRPKGKFVSVLSDGHHGAKRKVGTWKRIGRNGVRTTLGGRTDKMTYQLTGKDKLVLINPKAGGQKLFLERAPATK